MTITTTETETTAVVFDYASHDAEAKVLADDVSAKQTALDLAIDEAEAAKEAEEELDILSDSNSKITKVRLDHERAIARVAAAKTALSVAERAWKRHGGYDLAEALRPMVEILTNHHPLIPIVIVAGEINRDDYATSGSVVIINQLAPAEREGVDGRLTPSEARKWTSANAVVITHIYDRGYHRPILDAEALLKAARETRVTLSPNYAGGPLAEGWVYAHQVSRINRGEVKGGLWFDEIKLHPVTHEQVPPVPNPDPTRLAESLARGVVSRAQNAGIPTHVGDPKVSAFKAKEDGGVRTLMTTIRLDVAEAETGRSLPEFLHRAAGPMVGHVHSGVGRIVSVEPGPTVGSEVSVHLTAVGKAA